MENQKFPTRFVERIHEILPKAEWDSFFSTCTEPLPKAVRLTKKFHKTPEGWTLRPVAKIAEARFIERADQRELPLGKTLEHFAGQVYVASLSSLLSAELLNPSPGEKVLDVCAAPGTKTTFLAEKIGDTGVLVANELSSSRSKKLAANVDRLGLCNVVLTQTDGSIMNNFFDQEFDKILLDAPCSSEGFGRKDADFFEKGWSEKNIFESSKLQKRLIISAFEMLVPGGEMVYSTCTGAPEEDEMVVQSLLEKFPEAELVPLDLGNVPHHTGISKFFDQEISPDVSKNVYRLWPHLRSATWDSEIFFLAKIRKKEEISRSRVRKFPPSSPPQFLPRNKVAELSTRLFKTFGFPRDLLKDYEALERNGEISIASQAAATFARLNPVRRVGLPIFDRDGNPTSEFAINFGPMASQNVIQISNEQKEKWLEGFDLFLSEKLDYKDGAPVFVMFGEFCLGSGKMMKNGTKIKNKLDRDLVF